MLFIYMLYIYFFLCVYIYILYIYINIIICNARRPSCAGGYNDWTTFFELADPSSSTELDSDMLGIDLKKDGGTLCQRHVLVGKRIHGIQWDSKRWGFNMIQRSMMEKDMQYPRISWDIKIRWMVAKSCTTNLGWLKPKQNNGMFTTVFNW